MGNPGKHATGRSASLFEGADVAERIAAVNAGTVHLQSIGY
jgi:hypothetical protein